MEFQTGNPEPSLYYISLISAEQRKLPLNNVELTKTIEHRRIRGPFKSEQEAKQEEKKLLAEDSKLATHVWQCQRRKSPAMV
jgi:c-di-GMP-binding flagellar brake protein YcgR